MAATGGAPAQQRRPTRNRDLPGSVPTGAGVERSPKSGTFAMVGTGGVTTTTRAFEFRSAGSGTS